jgi:hypothetical protein
MKTLGITMMGLLFLVTIACTYDSIRMGERQRCGAMPQSQADRCYSRTSMTKEEYDTERRKAAASKTPGDGEKKPVDPRYEEWIP